MLLEVRGKKLAVEKQGSGDAVVLVHGLGSTSNVWEPQVRALADRFTMVRLDLEGVTFADACTIARLRSIAAALPEGGQLVLARVPAVVRRVLELTGLGHPQLRVEP